MPEISSCVFWREPSKGFLDYVRSAVSTNLLDQFEDVICCSSVVAQDVGQLYPNLQAYVLHLCRLFGLIPNKHTTYFSPRDVILAFRLVLDSECRKDGSIDGVMTSDLALCLRKYSKYTQDQSLGSGLHENAIRTYREFLENSNAVDDTSLCAYLNSLTDEQQRKNLLILGTPTSSQEALLLKTLVGSRKLYSLTIETSLDASFCQSTNESDEREGISVQVLECAWNTLVQQFKEESAIHRIGSAGQRFAEEVMLVFLRLVVNVRDELAVLRALMSPLISLPQSAFLQLKRMARLRGLSLCQAALSYITRVQLGGHSYAPSADCPLRPFLPQLTAFGEVMDKLQTITEEATSPLLAVKRILSYLTSKLLKTSAGILQPDAVKMASDRLNLFVTDLDKNKHIEQLPECTSERMTQFLHQVLDHCSSWHQGTLLALGASQKGTPVSLPSPFTFFRTPEDTEEDDSAPSLSQRIKSCISNQTPVCTKKFKAGLPWGVNPDNEEQMITNSEVLSEKLEVWTDVPALLPKCSTPQRSKPKQRGVKRSILGDITNHHNSILPGDQTCLSNEAKQNCPTEKVFKRKLNTLEEDKASELEKSVSNVDKPHEKNSTKVRRGKKNISKKSQPILKGQTNLNSFFRRMS